MKSQLGQNKNFKNKEKRSALRTVIVSVIPITASKQVLIDLSMLVKL